MKNFAKTGALLCCIILILALAACSEKNNPKEASKSGTEASETSSESPIVIRMYGNLDAAYLPFLNKMQEEFPEMKLEYEFQWDQAFFKEPERRMAHQDGSDLFILKGDALTSMTENGYLLNLTGENFSSRYHVSTMTSLNENGEIYGLPLPSDIFCLLCNKKILEENGISRLPKSIPELIDICKSLNANNQGAIIVDSELYSMLLHTSWLYSLEGYEWITDYNAGKTVMSGTPAETAWTTLKEIAKVSGCSLKDSSALPARKTALMQKGKYAFRISNIGNLKYMMDENPDTDLVALPFLGEGEKDQWVFYSTPQNLRYFAASKELDLPENTKKKEIVLKLLDWFSTSDAQKLLASCGGSAATYIDDIDLEQGSIMDYLSPVIETGHLTNSGVFERGIGDCINECVAKILTGDISPQKAAAKCDITNAAYIAPQEASGGDELIGHADETVYWRKAAAVTIGSPMTQLAAAAMAEAFPKADFAFAMAKNTATTLYEGDITQKDILECADGEADSELVLIQVTGKKLKEVMEMGIGTLSQPNFIIPYGIEGAGRLLHPQGLTYEADVTREIGDRITSITLDNGKALDPETIYTIAVSSLMVDGVTEPNFSGCEVTSTGKYLNDVLTEYIRSHKNISSPNVGFNITGAPVPLYELP